MEIEENNRMFCIYCKEPIDTEYGIVYRDKKCYHLECYHLVIDTPLNLDEDFSFGS